MFIGNLNSIGNLPISGVGTSYLLDTYSAAAAYSLRQLKTGVTNVVRVRRSSDSAESDFTATEITDGTLAAWSGANSAYVVTWYDQVGSSDLTQSTAANQPFLVESGVIIPMLNGNGIKFDGTNDSLPLGAAITALNAAPFTIFGLGRNNASTDVGIYLDQRDASSPNYGVNAFIDRRTNKAQFAVDGDGGVDQYNLISSDDTTSNRLQTLILDSSGDGESFLNGTSQETITTSNTTINGGANFVLGYQPLNTLYFTGVLGEIIIFNSDESANRTDIESDINTHYSIWYSLYSMSFDGVDETAYCPDDASLDISNNLSVSAWVKTTDTTTEFAVSKWAANPNLSYFLGKATGGYLYAGVSSDGGTTNAKLYRTTSATITDGNWHHVAFTFTSGTLKLYIDGTEITSVTKIVDGTCNSINNSNAVFALGSSSVPDTFWNGKIDEVAVYDTTVLSGADISSIYNSGSPNDLSELSLSGTLVSWWRCGDGATFPTIPDEVGSNTITMYNMESGDIQTDRPV